MTLKLKELIYLFCLSSRRYDDFHFEFKSSILFVRGDVADDVSEINFQA